MSDAAEVLLVKTGWVRVMYLILERLHFSVVRISDCFNGECDEVGGQHFSSNGSVRGLGSVAVND